MSAVVFLPLPVGDHANLNRWLRKAVVTAVDVWMAIIPRKRPSMTVAGRCKIVSHRGERNRNAARENTVRAFDLARKAGVWGIEADIRWTADFVPVVCHDRDAVRVFGNALAVGSVNFDVLRSTVPDIPSLAELIAEFGGNMHLMLELKSEAFTAIERQKQILRQHLADLRPVFDYHILALDPRLFEIFDIQPSSCCLPVAEENVAELSAIALEQGYGGLTGHFLLLDEEIRTQHAKADQRIGTGMIRSRHCLYREINRGVEWIFSDDAAKLQRLIDNIGAK
jgi:glycerophosphoryl diester phosphodiesterase